MTNEKENSFDIKAAAENLLSMFEDHMGETREEYTEGVSLISEEGLYEMSTFFGTVPEEERGFVFLAFLAHLYDEGHKYNMQQFLQMEEMDA